MTALTNVIIYTTTKFLHFGAHKHDHTPNLIIVVGVWKGAWEVERGE